MMKAFIKDIAYYLPETVLTNEQIVFEFPEWNVEKIASKVGVIERHIAAPDETATDMAIKAAKALFSKGKTEKGSIDFILFCTQSPDYKLPTSACIIQDKLGLSKKIGALDFNLGCSGYVYGLSLAKGLIIAGIAQNVLLLTAETYSKYLHSRDKGNRTIFGDAASATVVSSEGFAEIGEFSLGTDGAGYDKLIVKTGCSRYPEKVNDLSFDSNNNPVSSDFLQMNGSELFTFTLDEVPPLVEDTLKKNNLTDPDIDLYVFHQANKYMVDFLRDKLRIDRNKFYECLSMVGNTVSNSIPIALFEAVKGGLLTKESCALLAGFGVGYSWAGTILFF